MTAIQYRPAVRSKSHAMVGIGGPSGGGKTLSALLLARGLVMGVDEQIFGIDTENGRMLHYAPAEGEAPGEFTFRFQYYRLDPPFTPMRYQEAIEAAVKAKAGAVIVDSMSHEHEGEGGILEWHDKELTRMAGNDYEKRDKIKFTAWIEPKKAHNKLVNSILQKPVHFIFCFRAKDKIAPVKNAKGRTEFVNVGWTPICSDRFEYEMTALMILPPNVQGVPDLAAERCKLPGELRPAFPAGVALNEAAGRQLAKWCSGKSLTAKPKPPVDKPKPAEPESRGTPPATSPTAPSGNETAEDSKPPPEPSAIKQAQAAGVHEDVRIAYSDLYQELRQTRDPRKWWKDNTRALQMLEEQAPMLHADLVKLGASRQKRETVR
jgi:hypothetical protein